MSVMNLKKRGSLEFLVLLLLTDLVIFGIHIVAYSTPAASTPYWSVAEDRGFGETFQYIKELWLVFSFVALARFRSSWAYLSLALLFLYFFIDDLLFVHERVGVIIANRYSLPSLIGLRPEDLGEIVVSLIAAIGFSGIIGVSYWFGDRTFRHVCHRILVLIAGLAFCGIVIDAIHIVAGTGTTGGLDPLALLEDGGEMLFMSLMCWYGIALLQRSEQSISV
ncbi:hypothetical protein ACQ4M3_04700 [Leptolyngbya sp. AN03gr2]|uniref:hypothetical protein n=1 Tax=unclassified Leptolyngbya TaxID=2650499 RepID=UPI003D3102F2